MNMLVILLLGIVGSIAVFYCSKNTFSTLKSFLIGFLSMFLSCLTLFSGVYIYRLNSGDIIETLDLIVGTACLLGACVICGIKCATTFGEDS